MSDTIKEEDRIILKQRPIIIPPWLYDEMEKGGYEMSFTGVIDYYHDKSKVMNDE